MDPVTAGLRASLLNLVNKLTEITANPQPTYSEKGRSVSWDQHRTSLLQQIKDLAAIPGVAPEQMPSFQMDEYL